jgi:hypothetical protein
MGVGTQMAERRRVRELRGLSRRACRWRSVHIVGESARSREGCVRGRGRGRAIGGSGEREFGCERGAWS